MNQGQFEKGYLLYLMRRSDVFAYQLGTTGPQVDAQLTQALAALNHPNYEPTISQTKRVNTEMVFIPKSFEDKLYIRHLNVRLCRAYKVRHANREGIIRQIAELLRADVELNIIRADVKRFFRNVNFYALIDQFTMDGILSVKEIAALKRIADHTASVQSQGIPWGLSTSSTLAELFMRGFDQAIRALSGIYYYERFVDDIIIFTSRPAEQILNELEVRLGGAPYRLRLNPAKTILINEQANPTASLSINYLGYVFTRMQPKLKKQTTVTITIAPKKIDRYKRRILACLRRFCLDRNLRDLKSRLKLLTGNYGITKSSHDEIIKTGIYYNYRSITDTAQLKSLDDFLRRGLVSVRAFFHRKRRFLQMRRYRELFKFSFREGFNRRILHRFSRKQLEHLIGAWRDVD